VVDGHCPPQGACFGTKTKKKNSEVCDSPLIHTFFSSSFTNLKVKLFLTRFSNHPAARITMKDIPKTKTAAPVKGVFAPMAKLNGSLHKKPSVPVDSSVAIKKILAPTTTNLVKKPVLQPVVMTAKVPAAAATKAAAAEVVKKAASTVVPSTKQPPRSVLSSEEDDDEGEEGEGDENESTAKDVRAKRSKGVKGEGGDAVAEKDPCPKRKYIKIYDAFHELYQTETEEEFKALKPSDPRRKHAHEVFKKDTKETAELVAEWSVRNPEQAAKRARLAEAKKRTKKSDEKNKKQARTSEGEEEEEEDEKSQGEEDVPDAGTQERAKKKQKRSSSSSSVRAAGGDKERNIPLSDRDVANRITKNIEELYEKTNELHEKMDKQTKERRLKDEKMMRQMHELREETERLKTKTSATFNKVINV